MTALKQFLKRYHTDIIFNSLFIVLLVGGYNLFINQNNVSDEFFAIAAYGLLALYFGLMVYAAFWLRSD